jgi:hypothetical protein
VGIVGYWCKIVLDVGLCFLYVFVWLRYGWNSSNICLYSIFSWVVFL